MQRVKRSPVDTRWGLVLNALVIRRATSADVPDIARSRAQDPEWGPADPRTAAYLDGKHHPQRALLPRAAFVALQGTTPVGYIAGHLTQRYDCDGELQYLWVAPSHRRVGTASRLFEQMAEWFIQHEAARVCVDVVPDNAPARAFYRRHGAVDLNAHWLVWTNIGAPPDAEAK